MQIDGVSLWFSWTSIEHQKVCVDPIPSQVCSTNQLQLDVMSEGGEESKVTSRFATLTIRLQQRGAQRRDATLWGQGGAGLCPQGKVDGNSSYRQSTGTGRGGRERAPGASVPTDKILLGTC